MSGAVRRAAGRVLFWVGWALSAVRTPHRRWVLVPFPSPTYVRGRGHEWKANELAVTIMGVGAALDDRLA